MDIESVAEIVVVTHRGAIHCPCGRSKAVSKVALNSLVQIGEVHRRALLNTVFAARWEGIGRPQAYETALLFVFFSVQCIRSFLQRATCQGFEIPQQMRFHVIT